MKINKIWCILLISFLVLLALSCPKPVEVKPPKVPTLVNEVVFIEEPDSAKAVKMIEVGKMHVYAKSITDVELVKKIKNSSVLGYEISYGLTYELAFNPVGPTFPKTGKLNPFSVPAIREAMNWLVDRNYIVEEICGGLGTPRYFPLSTAFPDYVRLAHVARALEIEYAHNPKKARAIITEEMKKLGAILKDGKWHYQGEPVELIFLIRPEDERRHIGDYIATLLEELGFVVNRQYKKAAEVAPIWSGSDPGEGRWHLYTGGWTGPTGRDLAGNFDRFYTPRGIPGPLCQAYKPSPELDRIAGILARGNYQTLAEREKLMAEALGLTLKDSFRIWLMDIKSVWPRRAEIALTADLGGGILASWLWPHTLRFVDKEGGSITFGLPNILAGPVNPVAGHNWAADLTILRGTGDRPLLPDPFTGLLWPNRVKFAEVYVQEGLPVTKTLDWVSLSFKPSIPVPIDAWIDWDPVTQRFLTVGEVHPKGLSARTKTVVHYADDLYQRKWHDGTKMSLADLIMPLILTFDRAKKGSAIFDEAAVPAFEIFARHFRGVRIVKEDPLVVEVYSDRLFLDAELIVDSAARLFYPDASIHWHIPWHILVPGIRAEANRELAFSSSKATRLKIEWMSYLAGPSLAILERHRVQALEESFIPYANTLGKYISAEEAKKRYIALGEWYQKKRHFWVGNGPFYIDSVHPVEKIVVLKRSEEHLKVEEKWLAFTKPKIASVKVSGPAQVTPGKKAEFRIEVTFEGKPYTTRDIEFVRFLLFDAHGELVLTGNADPIRDGLWRVTLKPEQTKLLKVGSNRLEIIVSSRLVTIPAFASLTFVTLQK